MIREEFNPEAQAEQLWHRHDFYAMGCHMSAWLELADADLAADTLVQVEALFDAAEERLTRFAETSELSRLNARPNQWVPVSNVLWNVIAKAIQLAEQTDGLFDPTLLNALVAAGYDRSFNDLAGNQNGTIGINRASSTMTKGRWQSVSLDESHHAIWLPEGVRIDLGGIGKGYTAQQAVHFLSQWGPCLIDAGGDLVAGDAPSTLPGWPVAVAAPTQHEEKEVVEDLAQLWLKNATLATSGVDYRHWQQNGQRMHHLIDPRTDQPAATDLLTVSVLAADASVAEAWATALLIAGQDQAEKVVADKGLAVALVNQAGALTVAPPLRPFIQTIFEQ